MKIEKPFSPFGMLMPGRSALPHDYRFGFNGKENDNEVKGEGNSVNFGERFNDVRLGRWFSTDRFEAKYPAWSPYSSTLNNPLAYIDVNGDSVELIIGKPYTDANGKEHAYGHVALRIFNATDGYDKVYDFGRYGETWGIGSGEGILNAYTNADSYLKSEMDQRNSVGYMQPTTSSQDKQVMAYYDGMIKEGGIYKRGAVPGGGGIAYKLKNDYDVFYNNCTTVSSDGLDVIGFDWIGDEYDPRDALKIMEGSFKELRLTRTEYQKGGKISVTFKPAEVKVIEYKKPAYNIIIHQQDNARVATPVMLPETGGGN